MSMQDGTDDQSKVGEIVQQMIDSSDHGVHTKVYVHRDEEGYWYITLDHK
ncbi:hypothetical protein [Paenibacillus chitinolyticus]|nr:hypothetical protein [Paenibacillus chitinolyticus]MCY9593737.1 hypothetical protein [Paenibacillus chitinolyticus]